MVPTDAVRPPLRGRDVEREAVAHALTALDRARGCVIVIEGPAGIGKSRLLAEAMDIARKKGALVGEATAAVGHQMVPMGALLRAVTGGTDPLLPGEPSSGQFDPSNPFYWLVQDLEGRLEARASASPLMIVVDDLQWADSGTVAAVEVLSARLSTLPIAWAVGVRDTDTSDEVTASLGRMTADGATRVQLGPLTHDVMRAIVADLTEPPPDAEIEALIMGARGVPFWLIELTAELEEASRAEQMEPDANRLLSTAETLHRRFERLTPDAREVVSVASVLGKDVTFEALQRMLDRTAASLLAPVQELLRTGMLVEVGTTMAFRHDLVREGALATLPASARLALQRHAVDALLASGASPVEVASRLAESASPGDSEAIEILIGAVESLGGTDPEAAAKLARQTLALTPRDDTRRAPLVARTVILMHASGRANEAVAFADAFLGELPSPAAESEVRFGISSMISLSADVRASANRRALALSDLDRADTARHQARLLYNTVAAGRAAESRRLRDEIHEAVCAYGDQATLLTLQLADAALHYLEGRFAEALSLIEAADRAAGEAGATTRVTIAAQWRSEVLGMLDRFDEATLISENGLADAQRASQAWAAQLWEQWRGRQLSLLGQFPDAVAMLESTFRLGEMRPIFGVNDASALTALTEAALHTGDRPNLKRCAEIAKQAANVTPEFRRHAGWALVRLAMEAGDVSQARDHIMWLTASDPEGGPVVPSFPADCMDQARLTSIALAIGDRQLASSAVHVAEERARLNPDVAAIVGAARHARGLMDDDPDTLNEAVEALRHSQRRPALLQALADSAEKAGRMGDRVHAITLLDEALELANAMDAHHDSSKMRSSLRDLGVRRRLVADERPRHGWASLSASEVAVVRAITGGMTNREAAEALFLSPHTIGSHLRHVFVKLNINSRVELTRIAAENVDPTTDM